MLTFCIFGYMDVEPKTNTKMTELTTVAAPKGAQDALEELVRKMYISNVSKRLRELNQPTETDKKRCASRQSRRIQNH